MANSNFCRNCGARLTRTGLRSWLRGAHCEDCAMRLGSTYAKPLAVLALAAVAAFAFGRYLRPAPPPLILHRSANSPLSDLPVNPEVIADGTANTSNRNPTPATNAVDDTVYICGARTKKGTPCRRRVHTVGERCYQHKGMPAMVATDKLTIKP